MDQEAQVKTPRRNIFYRLQRYGYRKLPSLIPDPNIKDLIRHCREGDEEDNAKTEPPSDEFIDLRCIWSVEFYTPSDITKLFQSFKELGWDGEDSFISRISPARWIQQFRETPHGGGFYPLGPIYRPGDTRCSRHGRTALIPTHVDYALADMYSLTSSITCIVLCFILDENCSGRFDEALRRRRKTVLERILCGGYRIKDPAHQKIADIQSIRTELRASAAKWFRTQLPGLFARDIMEGEFPFCEFVTLRKAQPFPQQDIEDHESKKWLPLLDLDNDLSSWFADDLPGLKFAWPILRDKTSIFHAVIAAREDAFSDMERFFGGDDRTPYLSYVDGFVSGLLSRWALLFLISGFERHLNKIRDSAKFKPAQREKPLNLLRELSDHVSLSADIIAAVAELRHFTNQKVLFERELKTYKPSINNVFFDDKEITLSHVLRDEVEKRSVWLENLDRSIRDILIQYGAVIGTHENIRLQKRMSCLTGMMLFLTILMAVLTALTVYIAAKTINIDLLSIIKSVGYKIFSMVK